VTDDYAYISAIGGARIPLELETIEDTFEQAIARHEYPHVDGADLEKLGQGVRQVRLRAIFWDQPNHIGYDNHKALLELLQEAAQLELTHPKYGLVKGEINRLSVRHDDSERYAEVDFDFLEQRRESTAGLTTVVDVVASMEAALSEALLEEMSRLSAYAMTVIGNQADGILEVDLDPELGIMEQFTGVSRAAWDYVKKVDSAVNKLEGTLLEISSPANRLVSTIDFGTNLPGRVLGSLARCVERYTVLYDRLTGSPKRFLDSLRGGLLQLEASLPAEFASQVRAVGAARACLALGEIFGADDDNRRANLAAGATAAFDPAGNRLYSAEPAPVLTVREMEDAAALARAWVQEAIELDRTRTELKEMARTLIDHLSQVKVSGEELVALQVDQPLPLHLVCLAAGLPYRDAERLLAVNRIRRPNFTQGEVLVYG